MKNKVVLITGATSGIGKIFALRFGAAGAKVVVSGRRESEGNAIIEAIRSAGGEEGSDTREGIAGMHPIGSLGNPEEIAAAVLFPASEEASFVTGESIKVDGGPTAR